MMRNIINIDEEKCSGCGLCVDACHEGALVLVDGKARLTRDDYCDGLGACLPACPTGAITIEQREAAAYNETPGSIPNDPAVHEFIDEKHTATPDEARINPKATRGIIQNNPVPTHHEAASPTRLACGCPGTASRSLNSTAVPIKNREEAQPSRLRQWPVQMRLAPVRAPYFEGARLLIAADCAAYAYGSFHRDYMDGHITLIGCPKLDDTDYADKLIQILSQNDIRSLTVVRMEVPCCGGLAQAAMTALTRCGKMIPWRIVTLSADGQIADDTQ